MVQLGFCGRWLLVYLLLVSTCLLVINAKGGRGGGGRSSSGRSSGSSRSSYSRPSPSYSRPSPSYSIPSPSYSRPSPSYSRPSPSYSRPAPAPAPAYKPRPAPSYKPSPRPSYNPPAKPAPSYKPSPRPPPKQSYYPSPRPIATSRPQPPVASKPSEPVVVKQPAYNPNFKEPDFKQGTGDRQPAFNPNFKPDSGKPAGPPPPYSPQGQPIPNAPVGPSPPYQPGASFGKPPPGVQPPPYPGQPNVRPPAYPGLSPAVSYPHQSGGFPAGQHGVNRPYPVQPGYPSSFQGHAPGYRPYPVQPGYPGSFHQPNMNRPYPVQPGSYNPYPGVNRPYPQQSLGANVWQPQYGVPAPAYMNYGGIPTGTNMYTKPHKKKGFLGSLMSAGKSKHKTNKYYGSHPSPYGVGYMGGGGIGHMGGGFLGKHSSSAAMYTIFPYMAAKKIKKIHKPKFGFMPMYIPRGHYHHHHYHRGYGDFSMNSEYEIQDFDLFDDDYIGKCQKPIKKRNSRVRCKVTFEDIQCDAKCEDGYKFPRNIEVISNKCWHVTGIWRPQKNFPDCKPVCEEECLNGGECIRPGVCKCSPEFRGHRCQLHFMKCDIRKLAKEEKIGWVCNHSKNETVCKISCKEPGEFDSPPATEYKCTPEGVWKPETIPHCVVKDKPDSEVKV